MELTKPETELTFFSPRNSVNVFEDAKALYDSPETDLSPEQEIEVYEFAKSVYEGQYKDTKRQCDQDLEAISGMNPGSVVQNFYLGYFATARGKEDLTKMGIAGDSMDEVRAGLIDIEKVKGNVDAKSRKVIAKNSLDWYKDMLTDALAVESSLDIAHLDDEPFSVNYDPQKLIDKISYIANHRAFYRQVKADLRNEEENFTKQAKTLELELTIAKANNMLAGLYDNALELGKQLRDSKPSGQITNWMEQLEKLVPVIYRAVTRDRKEDIQKFESFRYDLARRTDFLQQGVALDEEGTITPISNELIEFAYQITRDNANKSKAVDVRMDKEMVDRLKETKWDGEKFKEFCETIIREWGWLSEHEADWSEAAERDGPAEDKKWQIIVGPQSDSIVVQRIKKILRIPASFNRDLVKTLSVAAHELAHLIQAESDSVLAEKIPLAVVCGRRTSNLREGGAVDQETKVYQMLGVKRPTSVAYLSALQTKLDGGNIVQVARAFYNNYEDESALTDDEKEANRKLAADRALRLYRNGGYNSQPLDYIEGELSRRALLSHSPETIEAIMLTGASFSLRDSARLHELGLYNPPQTTDKHPAEEVWRVFSQKYLPAIEAA